MKKKQKNTCENNESYRTIDRINETIIKTRDLEIQMIKKFESINPLIVHEDSYNFYRLDIVKFDMDEHNIKLEGDLNKMISIRFNDLHCIECDEKGDIYLHIKSEYLFNLIKKRFVKEINK
jgi:hypothetical protein